MPTIRVSDESMKRWRSCANHSNETTEDLVNRMLDEVEDARFAEEDLADAEEAGKDLAAGRCVPHDEVERRYGL